MAEPTKSERFSLSRWSRRKLESARAATEPSLPAPAAAPPAPADAATAAGASAPPLLPSARAVPELPPVESLTIDSDFAAFLRPEVDEPMRQKALRRLFSDPQFNVMDGLDVYIDDYAKTTPIPDDLMRKLVHARYILDPPKTRVNAQGFVEDVPEDELRAAAAAASSEAEAAGLAREGPAPPAQDAVASVAGDAANPHGNVRDAPRSSSPEVAPARDTVPLKPVADKPVEPAR
jgi:hypothetical protein